MYATTVAMSRRRTQKAPLHRLSLLLTLLAARPELSHRSTNLLVSQIAPSLSNIKYLYGNLYMFKPHGFVHFLV